MTDCMLQTDGPLLRDVKDMRKSDCSDCARCGWNAEVAQERKNRAHQGGLKTGRNGLWFLPATPPASDK